MLRRRAILDIDLLLAILGAKLGRLDDSLTGLFPGESSPSASGEAWELFRRSLDASAVVDHKLLFRDVDSPDCSLPIGDPSVVSLVVSMIIRSAFGKSER